MLEMLRLALAVVVVALCFVLTCPQVEAQGWQWPAQMTVAGFNITGISGRAGADGSGTATGSLQIPGMGGHRIDLNRSARGEITGRAAVNARVSGGELQGSFTLNSGGLRGDGTIKLGAVSITGASITISPGGQASGSGRVAVGRTSVPVSFTVSGGPVNVSGSASVQDETDTALANYRFTGTVSLQISGGRPAAFASGQVVRRGKLADQPITYTISGAPVELPGGRCTVNAGGVSVTFSF